MVEWLSKIVFLLSLNNLYSLEAQLYYNEENIISVE